MLDDLYVPGRWLVYLIDMGTDQERVTKAVIVVTAGLGRHRGKSTCTKFRKVKSCSLLALAATFIHKYISSAIAETVPVYCGAPKLKTSGCGSTC